MKKLSLVCMVAVALLFSGGATALTGTGFDPFTICALVDTNNDFIPFEAGIANGIPMPGTTVDFCNHYAELRGFLGSALVGDLCGDPEFASFCPLLEPCVADLNGTIVVDESSGSLVISAVGNGILDTANELGVIKHILLTPGFDNGVIDHATVLAAYERNFYQLQCDMQPDFLAQFSTLLPGTFSGLMEILTIHATIGDGTFTVDTSNPNGNISTATGSWGIVKGLVPILCDFIADQTSGLAVCNNPNLNKGDYIQFPSILGANGDADGDGATNFAEAQFFQAETCGTGAGAELLFPFNCGVVTGTTYVDAALDPNLFPPIGVSGLFVVANPHFPEQGDNVTIQLVNKIDGLVPAGLQWVKNLTPLVGEVGETVTISNVTQADNGIYYCEVDDGTKATLLSQSYVMNVQPQGSVPVGGGLAMGLLAGACALAGAMGIRRKS